jgi:dihydrofolate synthase/folylpolyglutamate synthase
LNSGPTGSFSTLADWLPWLETLSPREIVLGLDRVHTVLERLELNRPGIVIHVGGTNGKGSCVSMLDALVQTAGLHTGAYTSPHVHRYNERIRIDGVPATDAAIIDSLQLVEAIRGDVPLTFFEFGTLAALVAFDAAGVDAWILEVGLGGRLDAVNAIDPDVSLITNVSLDHCAWLGDDIESIAGEKAGIMRASRPVIFGSESVPTAIRQAAADIGAELRVSGEDYSFELDLIDKNLWSWNGEDAVLENLATPVLPGEVQVRNAAAVLATVEALAMDSLLDRQTVNQAFSNVQLDGRFQKVTHKCLWILDVAHNPAAAVAFANRFESVDYTGSVTAVVGMLQDKDVAGFLAPLTEFVDRWVSVTVDGARALTAIEFGRKISEQTREPCLIVDDIDAALNAVFEEVSPDDVVIVAGSFYIVGPALDWLQSH